LLDDSGSVTQRYKYRAFGPASPNPGSDASRFAFVGRQGYEAESDLDLYYVKARYLDPEAGRWISEDPIGIRGGDPNYYRYVFNEPTNKIDPSGLKCYPWEKGCLRKGFDQAREIIGGAIDRGIDTVENIGGAILQGINEFIDLIKTLAGVAWKVAGRIGEAGLKIFNDTAKWLACQFDGLLMGLFDANGFWAQIKPLFNDAQEISRAIWDKPSQFANTLAGGVVDGFTKFIESFPEKLKSSVLVSLFGSMGGEILTFIEVIEAVIKGEFKVAGEKLLEALGIGPEQMLDLALKALLGNNAPASGSVLEKVNSLLAEMDLTDAEAAQVEKMDTDEVLEFLFNKTLEKLDLTAETKEFVLTDLVPAVAVSLAALIAVQVLASLNPAGGIVRLLLLIVSAVQWIIEKGKCLIALVKRIGSSVGLLASGNREGLAGVVFDVLGTAFELSLSLLFKLLKVDALTIVIKRVLDKVRAKINQIKAKIVAILERFRRKPSSKKRCIMCKPGKMSKTKGKGRGKSGLRGCGQCFVFDEETRNGKNEPTTMGRQHMGQRCATWLPGESGFVESLSRPDTKIDPATHRAVWFLQEFEDGSWKKFGLLRSNEWFAEQEFEAVGDYVEVADLEEMGVEGEFQVMAIDPCPVIEQGPGRLITAEFQFSSGVIFELKVSSQDKPIRGTSKHPYWSEDRLDWVPLDELRTGERLLVEGGTAIVMSVEESGEEPVCNIEVDGDHCYRVGATGVLVHNLSDPCDCLPTVKFSRTRVPNIAANVAAALLAHPLWRILHYESDKSKQDANRRKACGATICPRPPATNTSCDEFPFASTKEGGTGAMTMCVPRSEQSSQGGTLGGLYGFYAKNNLKDNDPFCVQVVP